jgi:hypothetical protein
VGVKRDGEGGLISEGELRGADTGQGEVVMAKPHSHYTQFITANNPNEPRPLLSRSNLGDCFSPLPSARWCLVILSNEAASNGTSVANDSLAGITYY